MQYIASKILDEKKIKIYNGGKKLKTVAVLVR